MKGLAHPDEGHPFHLGGFGEEESMTVIRSRHRQQSPSKHGLGSKGHPSVGQFKATPNSQEPTALTEFHHSIGLTWKLELILEEQHKDMVESLLPSSTQLITALERALFLVALHEWQKQPAAFAEVVSD